MEKNLIISKLGPFFSLKDEIRMAYLFGSALNKTNPNDIDIAIYLNPQTFIQDDFFQYQSVLIAELVGLLKFNNVDLSILNNAGPVLCMEVLREGLLIIAKDDDERVLLENRIRQQYIDTKPLRKIKHLYLSERYGT